MNVRMKRLLVGAISIGVLAVAGACGSSTSRTERGEIGGEVRFTWWGSDTRNEHTNAVIDLFENKFEVTVSGEPVDFLNYFERLNVQAAGGNMPCVTQMLSFALNDYATKDLLVDLGDSEDLDLDSLDENVLDGLRTEDGALHMAPYGIAPWAILYNQDMAQKYGLEIPSGDMTWDDFWAMLETVQKSLPTGTYAIDYPYSTAVEVVTYLASRGPVFEAGRPVFAPADLASWFDQWSRLVEEGVALPGERINDYAGSHEDSGLASGVTFASTRAANAIIAVEAGMKSHGVAGSVGHSLLPVGADGTPTDLVAINGFSVPKSCDNVASAEAFIDFWINDESANVAFAANNGAPPIPEYRDLLLDDPNSDPYTKSMIGIAQDVVNRGYAKVDLPPGFQTTFVDAYRRVSIDVLTGATSSTEAAQELFDVMVQAAD